MTRESHDWCLSVSVECLSSARDAGRDGHVTIEYSDSIQKDTNMLKHCHNSSIRLQRKCGSNPETASLNSTLTVPSSCGSSDSNTSESSLNCSFSPEMFNRFSPEPISLSSRASSFSSLAGSGPKTPIKVFASCLRPDIEYKTLSVCHTTTARELIWQLLAKFKMRHRDPKLFYLTMEVQLQKTGSGSTRRTLVLEDEAKPAELKMCNPWGECKFSLQMRKGGLVRVYDSVLVAELEYKAEPHLTRTEIIAKSICRNFKKS